MDSRIGEGKTSAMDRLPLQAVAPELAPPPCGPTPSTAPAPALVSLKEEFADAAATSFKQKAQAFTYTNGETWNNSEKNYTMTMTMTTPFDRRATAQHSRSRTHARSVCGRCGYLSSSSLPSTEDPLFPPDDN
ncbi:unnamed protein product [Calypogeia fissa]